MRTKRNYPNIQTKQREREREGEREREIILKLKLRLLGFRNSSKIQQWGESYTSYILSIICSYMQNGIWRETRETETDWNQIKPSFWIT